MRLLRVTDFMLEITVNLDAMHVFITFITIG